MNLPILFCQHVRFSLTTTIMYWNSISWYATRCNYKFTSGMKLSRTGLYTLPRKLQLLYNQQILWHKDIANNIACEGGLGCGEIPELSMENPTKTGEMCIKFCDAANTAYSCYVVNMGTLSITSCYSNDKSWL